MDRNDIERALEAVGQLLASDGERLSIVIIGGAALRLLGVVDRVTRDVDIVAVTQEPGELSNLARPPKPLPEALRRAIQSVVTLFGLPEGWLNAGPAGQWDLGLPEGFASRLHWRHYSALDVGIADPVDLVFFKLEAAADQPDASNRHFNDLVALNPSPDDLQNALIWAREKNQAQSTMRFLTRW